MQLFNPVYRKIEADLRQQIHDGVWRQGVALPSRRELAGRYSVETSTIQKAIRALLARIMHVEIKTPTVCILDGLQYVSLPLRHVGGAERFNLDSVLICALENDR